jgi:hypothetical protein
LLLAEEAFSSAVGKDKRLQWRRGYYHTEKTAGGGVERFDEQRGINELQALWS